MLPMIDVNFSKENALPFDLFGLIYHDWRPTPEEGVTVFLQGLEKRGDNNLRKRIYFSGVTPDLYKPMYQRESSRFFRQAFRSAIREQAIYAALPRLLFRSLLGPSPWSNWRRYPVRRCAKLERPSIPSLPTGIRCYPLPMTTILRFVSYSDFLKAWIDERIGDIKWQNQKS